jgi:hypothetical protein
MKIKRFIKKLQEISERHGEKIDVIMADNTPVVNPIFSQKYFGKKVVITDSK